MRSLCGLVLLLVFALWLPSGCRAPMAQAPDVSKKPATETRPAPQVAAQPEMPPVKAAPPARPAAAAKAVEIIIDDADEEHFAVHGDTWKIGAEFDNYEEEAHYTEPEQGADVKAVWTPDIKVAGEYEVSVWVGSDSAGDHATDAPFTVNCAGGSKTVRVDTTDPDLWGDWKSLGVFKFDAGTKGNVTLTTDADGNVVADAVRFAPKE